MSLVGIKQLVTSAMKGDNNSDGRTPLLTSDGTSDSSRSHYGTGNMNADRESALGGVNSEFGEKERNSGIFSNVDPRVMSDLIIGLSDGLTVPFALTAGLSSLGDSKLVITGGFAELISGAISMGLGGYLGAKSESDYYHSEVREEKRKFYSNTQLITHDIEDILLEINPDFSDETIVSFIKDLKKDPELMVDFIIRYGRGLEVPAENRQIVSAATIGGGYFVGGFIPLLPYFFVEQVGTGLLLSIIVMAITLFAFGFIKTQISMNGSCTLSKKCIEGVQMMAVGGTAAASAWFFVKLLG
ncbi:HHR195Wp [Eremothecium sinecaudum]|uniref:HHR195Wp n=1 Tax=Eremothecium sinecaudum TaxID=45286 RepID=A0A0X8HWT5_9SACH|nr:HHR195Wp [Eremothecium sinecaudum]AMD22964.1 HHR195Wp [Eremothecium sinecaudum]